MIGLNAYFLSIFLFQHYLISDHLIIFFAYLMFHYIVSSAFSHIKIVPNLLHFSKYRVFLRFQSFSSISFPIN